ncbi:hypothetical protein F5050DRAFT_1556183, partial [Lentinula boryana]
LHLVFHCSLLEPYKDPSLFHAHADPIPIELSLDLLPTIDRIVDSCKIGQRYDYLIHWKDQPDSEDSWVNLTDLPTPTDELVDKFHRRHPRS